MTRLIVEHGEHQLFEFTRNQTLLRLTAVIQLDAHRLGHLLRVPLPEELVPLVDDAFEQVVGARGFLEGIVSADEEEEDHAGRENVGVFAKVASFARNDLRSFVTIGADPCFEETALVPTLRRSSKAEISQFQSKIVIHEYIFKFQVSVSESLAMTVVQSFKYLLEKVSSNFLREASRFGS